MEDQFIEVEYIEKLFGPFGPFGPFGIPFGPGGMLNAGEGIITISGFYMMSSIKIKLSQENLNVALPCKIG